MFNDKIYNSYVIVREFIFDFLKLGINIGCEKIGEVELMLNLDGVFFKFDFIDFCKENLDLLENFLFWW